MKITDKEQEELIHAIVDPWQKRLERIVNDMKPMRRMIRAAIRAEAKGRRKP